MPQIDAQNSSSIEGVQVFPIGTWVGIRFCINSFRVSKGYMCVFQLEVKIFKDPPLPHTPTQNWFSKTQIEAFFKISNTWKGQFFYFKKSITQTRFFLQNLIPTQYCMKPRPVKWNGTKSLAVIWVGICLRP